MLTRGAQFAPFAQPALVNGTAGLLVAPAGKPFAVLGFTIADGRIVEVDLIADLDKLRALAISERLGGVPRGFRTPRRRWSLLRSPRVFPRIDDLLVPFRLACSS